MTCFLRMLSAIFCLVTAQVGAAFQANEPAPFTIKLDGAAEETLYDSVADENGNLYVVGAYASISNAKLVIYSDGSGADQQRVEKSSYTLPNSKGGSDLLVAKFDSLGNRMWVKTLGGSGQDAATGVVYDPVNQRVFVAGYITGNDSGLEGVSATTATGFDVASTTNLFVAALDVSNGFLDYVNTLPLVRAGTSATITQLGVTTGDNRADATRQLHGNSLALAFNANNTGTGPVALYIKGQMQPVSQSGAKLGITADTTYGIDASAGSWAFVAKVEYRENPLQASGEQRWAWRWMTPVSSQRNAQHISSITQIATDPLQGVSSPVFVTGYWSGALAAGAQPTRIAEGANSGFVAAIRGDTGTTNFIATVGGDSALNALVPDDAGNLVVAGQIARIDEAHADITLSPSDPVNGMATTVTPEWYSRPLSSPRFKHQALVAKLSQGGDWIWATVAEGRYSNGLDLQRGMDGGFYLTGGLGQGTSFNGIENDLSNLSLGELSVDNNIASIDLPAKMATYALASPAAVTSQTVFSQAWHDATLSCPAGNELINGRCYSSCNSPYAASGAKCVRAANSYTTGQNNSCGSGYTLIGSYCYDSCDPDDPWLWDNTRCWDGEFSYSRDSYCPGQVSNGVCYPGCQAGYSRSGATCSIGYGEYTRPSTVATAGCMSSNGCQISLANSSVSIQLLRNGVVFGSTVLDAKARGKGNYTVAAEVSLMNYLDSIVSPNPKSVGSFHVPGNGQHLLWNDQWQLRFVHNGAATDANIKLTNSWDITFNLGDGRTNISSLNFNNDRIDSSTGTRTWNMAFPAGFVEPELMPDSFAYVARFHDTGSAAEFDWLQVSDNQDTHGALLVLSPLQTLYLIGGRGHFPLLSQALLHTEPYATRDNSSADQLASRGAILNVINPDTGAFIADFLRYFEYKIGDRIDPPAGGINVKTALALRRTIPAGMADTVSNNTGLPLNKKLLSSTASDSLYATGPLSHGVVLWPTQPSTADLHQPKVGRAIKMRWPTPAESRQDYIYSTDPVVTLPPLVINPENATTLVNWIQYAETLAGAPAVDGIQFSIDSGVLTTTAERMATLVLLDRDLPSEVEPNIVAVRSYDWTHQFTDNVAADIGSTLMPPEQATASSAGYVMTAKARYDIGAQVYNRVDRTGQIIPVNNNGPDAGSLVDDLIVGWYQTGAHNREWPVNATRYVPHWPAAAGSIVIASNLGSKGLDSNGNAQSSIGMHAAQNQPALYFQNDRNLPGYNPNEEHALLYQPSGSDYVTAYALRTNLNNAPNGTETSEPYVLVRYFDPADTRWKYRVWQVELLSSNGGPYPSFTLNPAIAGVPVSAPYPLNLPGMASTQTNGSGTAFWLDKNGQVWSRSTGSINVNYFYRMQDGFWIDNNGDGILDATTDLAWPVTNAGAQVTLDYTSQWPAVVPEMLVGETLLDSRNGLPDLRAMQAVSVVYDENDPVDLRVASANRATQSSVRLFDFDGAVAIPLPASISAVQFEGTSLTLRDATNQALAVLPARLNPDTGHYYFPRLPSDLRYRLGFNPYLGSKGEFYFQGGDFNAENGRPATSGDPRMILTSIMTAQERDQLRELADTSATWSGVVDALFQKTRNPQAIDLDNSGTPDSALLAGFEKNGTGLIHKVVAGTPILTTAFAQQPGYVVLAENVDEDPDNASPVNLHVIKVVTPTAEGSLNVIRNADNALDQRLVVRQDLDFGGRADELTFDWWWHPDVEGEPAVVIDPVTGNPQGAQWRRLEQGAGLNALTLSSGLPVLADGWVIGRYHGLLDDNWSAFSGQPNTNPGEIRAMPASGWVRRVLEGINSFEQRYSQFHDTEANSYTSMLVQAGKRYEGDVALSTENGNLNSVGLIELYQTVMNNAIDLSIEANNPITDEVAVNKQLLLAASRIADLYLLLGNEAYSDAMDPTVGIKTSSGDTGYLAPTLFAFSEQQASLLDEELALLRGVDHRNNAPVYNRLPWNFSSGTEGEPTYVQVYGIADTNGNGALDDARILYPQGHGDAWGHYLTATKQYYALARHPNYDWQPITDTTSIAGIPVQVDYRDEERFARAAAAKARTGASIVDLTFRQQYTHAPSGQWQGYKDVNPARAWGMDGWARRTAQAAVLDWALGNALLPYEDTASPDGIQRIDRQTVTALSALPAALTEVETLVTRADSGNNPFGLASDAIPFDIDPTALLAGETHFDQIYKRAVQASTNALRLFDYANDLSQQIRSNQLSTAGLQQQIAAQEQDYKSRLIELMGYPYAGEIGSGKLYPTGYTGPDIYHYMYIDSALNPLPASQLPSFSINYSGTKAGNNQYANYLFPGDADPANTQYFDVDELSRLTVRYAYNSKADYAFVAPSDWGGRRAPGRLQLQLGEVQLIQARINTALAEHQALIGKIGDEMNLLQETYGIRADQIQVYDSAWNKYLAANTLAVTGQATADILEKSGTDLFNFFRGVAEAPPKIVGFAVDATSMIRSVIWSAGTTAQISLSNVGSGIVRGLTIPAKVAADQIKFESRYEVYKEGYRLDVVKQLTVVESLLRDELVLRSRVVELQQQQTNANGLFLQLLGEAARVMEEREMFRRDIASRTLDQRYQDMTYRVFRNDALQKYRASFDLAARYTYLAAKAFDYETGLLSDDSTDQNFYEDLVRQRTLGYFANGTTPVAGVEGLSSPLAQMNAAFSTVKGNYGFYTPSNENLEFSLRREAFRIGFSPAASSQAAWQQLLQNSRVADLWQVPEFRRFCRPPQAESSGAIPGMVLRFSTLIDFGHNLFGWPLGPGDHSYDSSRAATKFRSVGLQFDGYPGDQLAATPRAYLVPAGDDVLRSPTRNGELRQYTVLDQSIPLPVNPVGGDTGYQRGDWIPANDDVSESWANLRRFSQLPVTVSSVLNFNSVRTDTRLVGRSVWNTDWLLIIPGSNLLSDGDEGIKRLINGNPAAVSSNGISDIRLYFDTYSTSGE